MPMGPTGLWKHTTLTAYTDTYTPIDTLHTGYIYFSPTTPRNLDFLNRMRREYTIQDQAERAYVNPFRVRDVKPRQGTYMYSAQHASVALVRTVHL